MNERVAIICENDRVWGLRTWERALPLFREEGIAVRGFWLCPKKLANLKSHEVNGWYLRTFGIHTFIKLGAYAAAAETIRLLGACLRRRSMSFRGLCRHHKLGFGVCVGPNDSTFIEWLEKNQIDILVIMVGHILKDRLLTTPRLGIINKHAALLPAHKGLFPYFWARLSGDLQGISFHTVVREIDAGNLLVQEQVEDRISTSSMIRFYGYVFERYPGMLVSAIRNLSSGNFTFSRRSLPSSYHGLPSREDVRAFEKQGGVVITWRDVWSSLMP
ncbi:MAG: formyltransferase family protein [Pyrinomonadaceae bacterium]